MTGELRHQADWERRLTHWLGRRKTGRLHRCCMKINSSVRSPDKVWTDMHMVTWTDMHMVTWTDMHMGTWTDMHMGTEVHECATEQKGQGAVGAAGGSWGVDEAAAVPWRATVIFVTELSAVSAKSASTISAVPCNSFGVSTDIPDAVSRQKQR